MAWQATLPFFSLVPSLGRSAVERGFGAAGAAGAAVDLKEIQPKRILERRHGNGSPFSWSVDAYRGFETPANAWEEFPGALGLSSSLRLPSSQPSSQLGPRRLLVKTQAPTVLRRELGRHDLRNQTLALGIDGDPYPTVESAYRLTRGLLRTLLDWEGLELTLTTRSPWIARDASLLRELDARHTVRVRIPISAFDGDLAQCLEPGVAAPTERLAAVERLAREGIETRLIYGPLMPGLNESSQVLRPFMAAARDAGASDVVASPFSLRTEDRGRFLNWMSQEMPELLSRYRRLYAWRGSLSDEQKNLVMAPFRQLRLAYGFPGSSLSRG
jgi:DNA repair photolyase